MKKIKFPKVKRVSKSKMKKKAWDMFSKWIRMSNSDEWGIVECYTCPKTDEWQKMDAGHGIEGRNNAVLFLKEVVKPQCKQCNIFKHGNLRVFTLKLLDKLGHARYKQLLDASNTILQYKTWEYEEIYNRYKAKVDSL